MKNKIFLLIFLLASGLNAHAQKTEHVFFITLDGLRWQELFTGADLYLVDHKEYVEKPEELRKAFWKDDSLERREVLMPFFWHTIAKEGQIWGNRAFKNYVNCSNKMWFSYPGYNEILTGFADDGHINSNDKINNPNVTILEYLNQLPQYRGKVATFGSWDVFPYIINEERSGLYVNAGGKKALKSGITEKEELLNILQDQIRGPWGTYVRLDAFTHHFAKETLRKQTPDVLYIAYGETDDFAHDGEYDEYLKSAQQTDAFIQDLWEYAQNHPVYRNKTTLVITTDHGRGEQEAWTSHGKETEGSVAIWIAVMGPDTPALGEVKEPKQLYQNQVARTIAALLGVAYEQPKAGEVIKEAIK